MINLIKTTFFLIQGNTVNPGENWNWRNTQN